MSGTDPNAEPADPNPTPTPPTDPVATEPTTPDPVEPTDPNAPPAVPESPVPADPETPTAPVADPEPVPTPDPTPEPAPVPPADPAPEPTPTPAPFILTADQMVPMSVAFTDDHGNPVTSGFNVTWSSSDPSILAVSQSDDGLSVMVSAVGPDGSAQLSVIDSVSGIGGQQSFTIVSGVAASAVITPGVPVATVAGAKP